jgi:hypothetical protein
VAAFVVSVAVLAGLIYLWRPRVKAWLRVFFEYPEARIRMERELSDVPGWIDDERS